MTLGLITVKDNQFVKEINEGGWISLGKRKLGSPAQEGWTDGEYALLIITEVPLTVGKERTGEAPIYTVNRTDIEKRYPERDPLPPPPDRTRAEKVDDLLAITGLNRTDFLTELDVQTKTGVRIN